MKESYRNVPFSFAEVMIAAPWACSILTRPYRDDKASMLHSNIGDDQRFDLTQFDNAAPEVSARAGRAPAIGNALRALATRLAAVWKSGPASAGADRKVQIQH